MFIVDYPNQDLPNGGEEVFSYDHNFRVNMEQNDSLQNKNNLYFKLFLPKRYDILIDNVDYLYECICDLEKNIIPVIYCLHEASWIIEFIEIFKNLIEKNKPINHFILVTNCELDLTKYSEFFSHIQTNHLLSFYSTSIGYETLPSQTKIERYLHTHKSKIFLNLNKNTTQDRPHRLRLLCWYLKNNLMDWGYISSILPPERKDNTFASEYKQINSLEDYYEELVERQPIILDFDGNDESDLSLTVDSHYLYNETLFSIVTETSYTNTRIFITEKTPKSFRNLHPFLILGDWNIHKKLEELGFKLYHDLIDYSFDSIKDNDLRFIKFTEEVSRLIKNKDIIYEWYKSNTDKLIYNYEHLINTFNIQNETEYISNYLQNFNLDN
jgi:hypothetical protein